MRDEATDTIDEDARRRFESAWASGRPEPIEQHLPPAESSRYAATLLELALIELEMSWKTRSASGTPGPRVEDYLTRFPALRDPKYLAKLLHEEFQIRHRHGDNPVMSEYRARFPQLALTDVVFDTVACQRDLEPDLPTIPGLEIIGVLGRGGMGVVYKACQTNLNRTVAVKQILPSSGVLSPDDLTRFRNESHAVARLRHPNIVQVHEVGQFEGRPFLILEFMEGGTLAKRLAGTPQTPRAAAEMLRCLAQAVQAIHAAGLLHRDLKPGNILLSEDGTLKITDFGLTKRVTDPDLEASALTATGAIVGTPSYMAPEQAAGRNREVGPAADTYALGGILYEMLTGSPPFRGETAMATVMQVVHQDPVPPRRLQPKVPRDLETICLKCLEKDSRRRYESAAQLANDLDRFLDGESIQARPVGAVERGWRWCRRKPAQASLAILLALVGVGSAVGWFVWQGVEHRRELDLAAEESKKRDDESRRKEQRRAAAETNRTLALVELHAGRFASARQLLKQARDHLLPEPTDDPLASAVTEQFGRVDRLASFYRDADKAERLAFVESDLGALRTCENGLKSLGVFEHPQTWWTKLPVEDLRPEQSAKLLRDVDHQLTLLAGLWFKEGQDAGPKSDQADVGKKVLEILKLGERYRDARKLPPSLTGRILEGYIYAGQLRLDKIRRLNGQEPENASDCYFIGVALFWLSQNPDDWISKAVKATFPIMGVKIGESNATAERLFRQAVAEEPTHFWSHFWLGWCLTAQKDFAGAELAFTACTTLHPEEGLAYAQRARVLAILALKAEAGPIRGGLLRRFEADAERATRFTPHDWHVQLPLLDAFVLLGRQKEATAAAGRILDLITPTSLLQTRMRDEQELMLKSAMPLVDFREPIDPVETHSVMAVALVLLKKDTEALRRADMAAELAPNHPRVHTVRGIVHLRKKELTAAAIEFRAALAAAPNSFLARAALSRTQELDGDFKSALLGYQTLVKNAATDGQRLAGHMGCYRNLIHLGRTEDADKQLTEARLIDPKASPKLP